MPGLDGWAAQKKVLDSGSNRPVIFYFCRKAGERRRPRFECRGGRFLQKPVDGQTLVDLINAVVEKKDSTDEIRK